MSEYKPNSHRSKTENTAEKRVEKVVSRPAKTKKKNGIAKLTDAFLTQDIGSVKSYVLVDVIIPTIKKAASDIMAGGVNMIADVLKNGFEMFLYGEVRNGKRKDYGGSSRPSYRSYYESRDTDRRTSYSSRGRTGYDYDEIVYESRRDAERVLGGMRELIADYHIASVANLFEMADITPDYTANKYGWTDLTYADVVSVRDGYVLKLPKAMPLD